MGLSATLSALALKLAGNAFSGFPSALTQVQLRRWQT
jgi:hypothetical protein